MILIVILRYLTIIDSDIEIFRDSHPKFQIFFRISKNFMFFMSLTHQRLNANLEARVSAEYLNFKELKTAANKISLHFLIDM